MLLSKPDDGRADRTGAIPPREGFLARFSFGVLLFAAATGVLAWNEQSVVDAMRDSGHVTKAVSEVDPGAIDPSQDGRLVHLTGTLVTTQPLSDPAMGLTELGLVRLKRTVEMYQWRESRQSSAGGQIGATDAARATYTYAKKWSEEPIDSRAFKASARHENPPMPIRTELVTAGDATIGDRVLAPSLLAGLDAFEMVAPPLRAPAGFTRRSDGLYRGTSADTPEIGDIRVTFTGVPAQPVSILAEQRGSRLVAYPIKRGKNIAQVAPGHVSASALFAQRHETSIQTWLLRAAGFGLVALALTLMSSSLSFASDRPYALAVGLAAAMTSITIGFAWIAFRPLFGTLLIVGAVLIVTGFGRLRHVRLPPLPSPSIPAV